MKIEINRRDLKQGEVDIQNLLGKISYGKAILFTGAGFSKGTLNVNGKEPPTAKELAHEICRLGNFDEDDDLRYAADYYLSNSNVDKLIDLLKNKFSISQTEEIHNLICSLGWRRFYTTNYDKSIEISSLKNGKVVECIDTGFSTAEYYMRDGLCIHLNGSIESLTKQSLNDCFKLSNCTSFKY
jgi:hypothetical protein